MTDLSEDILEDITAIIEILHSGPKEPDAELRQKHRSILLDAVLTLSTALAKRCQSLEATMQTKDCMESISDILEKYSKQA